jgi:hypothetical protein
LEANVTTCEQCGANAVDERGICGNCGWEADARAFRADEDAQSLGETRAAQVQTSVGPAREQRGTMNARFERTSQLPQQPPARTTGHMGTGPGAPSSTSRFCGTCGARIVGNEAFCGQCGTPVGQGSGDFGTAMDARGSGPGQYGQRGGTWAAADGDAPTEAFVVSPAPGYGRSGLNGPYGQAAYTPGGSLAGQPADDSSRSVKTMFGVLCLVGSIVSAIAAVILALHP